MSDSNVASGTAGPITRLGVVTGTGILIIGLGLGIVDQARPAGLGVIPSLARNPLHLQASIQIFCGAVALMLALLWHLTDTDRAWFRRLRPVVVLTLVMCALSAALTIGANWLIMTGQIAHYHALIPSLSILVTAILYLLAVRPLSGSTEVNLGARLALRGSYLWLLVTATLQFFWVAGRVFGDPQMLWFLERPTLEVALLGFVMMGSLGLLLTGLPSISHSRDLIRTMVRTYQATNALVFGWGAMQAWVIRFPGSYQGLVLSLVGLGLLFCCLRLADSSKLLVRNPAGGSGSGLRWEDLLASLAIVLKVVATTLLAVTAVVAAGRGETPLPALFAALLVCVGTGVMALSVASVVVAIRERIDFLMGGGTVLLSIGVLSAIALWAMVSLVERPLQSYLAGSGTVMAAGLCLILLSALLFRIPRAR